MLEHKTIVEMSRWELATLVAGFTIVTPSGVSYSEWDVKWLQMSAFVQFIQLDRDALLELAREALRQYKEKPDQKFLVES
jgi:hypothetical protein